MIHRRKPNGMYIVFYMKIIMIDLHYVIHYRTFFSSFLRRVFLSKMRIWKFKKLYLKSLAVVIYIYIYIGKMHLTIQENKNNGPLRKMVFADS